MPIGATYTFPKLAHEWLKHELDPEFSRAAGTILANSGNLVTGTVLGRITKGAATSAAKAGGNTGNGTLTLDATTPVLAGAKAGVYTVRCIAAAANGGTFRVEGPDGLVMGDVAVAGTFSEHLKFVIADGSSDFVVGDGFDITVAAGSGKYAPHNPTAVDGREIADAILLNGVDTTGADAKSTIIVRSAVINPLALTWHSSVDDATKQGNALAHLAAKNIITRTIV